jgi:hypothetical protein
MKNTFKTFFLLMLATSGTSYAQSIRSNWVTPGQCMGLMIGVVKFGGVKPADIPQTVIDTNRKYMAKLQGAEPKQTLCKNKSANVDEFLNCVKKIEPKSDSDYLLGVLEGKGIAEMNKNNIDKAFLQMLNICIAVQQGQ